MKLIKLGGKKANGQSVMVDDEDFEYLNQFNWFCVDSCGLYVKRNITLPSGKQRQISMHRELMKAQIGEMVDHKDRNTLNNQKSNLRIANDFENKRNTNSRKNSSSKYIGVSIAKTSYISPNGNTIVYTKWLASIRISGKQISLGKFPFTEDGEIEAAKLRDKFSKIHHGEFASLNFNP